MGKKRYFFIFFIIVFICLLGLISGEIILRLFSPGWLQQRMATLNSGNSKFLFGNDIGWPVELVNGKFVRFLPFSTIEFSHYEYHYDAHFDEWGGRVIANQPPFKSKVMIPFMGDSFIFGIGVEDNETYVNLLAAYSNIRYLNLGVPGSGLPEQLDILECRHKELNSPPLYIFNFSEQNDFHDLLRYYKYIPDRKGRAQSKDILQVFLEEINMYAYHNPLLKKLYIIQFIKVKLLYYYARITSKQLIEPIFLIADKSNVPYLSEAERCLDKEISRCVSLSNQLHFKTIFIIIPSLYQVYPDLLKLKCQYYGLNLKNIDITSPNRILRAKLEARHIPYIDILECMRHKGNGLYYALDSHLTAAGNIAVAECLREKLEKTISDTMQIDK